MFAIVSMVSIALAVGDRHPYSLKKMFYLFSLFFYGIVPWIQYISGVRGFWGMLSLNDGTYLVATSYILLYLFVFEVTYRFYHVSVGRKMTDTQLVLRQSNPTLNKLLIIVSMLALLLIFLWGEGGNIYNMLLRGGSMNTHVSHGGSVGALVYNHFIRLIPFMIFFYYYLLDHRSKGVTILLLVLAVLSYFPSSGARLQVASLYIPLLLLTVPLFSRKNWFVLTLVFGLLFVFPFVNQFRYWSVGGRLRWDVDVWDSFLAGDYDAYMNFAFLTGSGMVEGFRQLAGAMLFWVPRSVWPGKPIGSGAQMAHEMDLSWSNISMTFPGEGYINAGLLGILIFAIVIAVIFKRMDEKYWKNTPPIHRYLQRQTRFVPPLHRSCASSLGRVKNRYNGVVAALPARQKINYLVVLGMSFFFLRGDLMSGFAFTVGSLLCSGFVDWMVRRLSRFR